MAWVQADLDALDAAIAAHARGQLVEEMEFSDQRYKFATATLEERMRLRAVIAAALGLGPRTRYAATSKGA